jgi:hypothetical protein
LGEDYLFIWIKLSPKPVKSPYRLIQKRYRHGYF